jgi:hypothetical protein
MDQSILDHAVNIAPAEEEEVASDRCICQRIILLTLSSCSFIIREGTPGPGEKCGLILKGFKRSVCYVTTALKSGLCID